MVSGVESLLVAPAAYVPAASSNDARPHSFSSSSASNNNESAFQISLSQAALSSASSSGSQFGGQGGQQGGQGGQEKAQQGGRGAPTGGGPGGGAARSGGGGSSASGAEELTEEEEEEVQELQKTDQEVRAHEQAHATAGGPYAGAPKYQFTTGPDGNRYATSGEVDIDVSPEKTPEATIRKMDIVIRAALAPAEPSPQDMRVANQAQQQRSQAQVDLQQQKTAEFNGEAGSDPSDSNAPESVLEESIDAIDDENKQSSDVEKYNAQAAEQAARAYEAISQAIPAGSSLFGTQA